MMLFFILTPFFPEPPQAPPWVVEPAADTALANRRDPKFPERYQASPQAVIGMPGSAWIARSNPVADERHQRQGEVPQPAFSPGA
jgi:hypothetical protein